MRRSLAVVALILPLAAACAEPADEDEPGGPPPAAAGLQSLAKAAGWRDGLFEDPLEQAFAVVEVAFDRASADRAWDDNVPADLEPAVGPADRPGRFADLDVVDFDTQVVVVWSAGESGSCPEWLADIQFVDGTVELRTDRAPAEACTDDYNPYRMVLAVDRDRVPEPAQLPTTEVLVDGRTIGAGVTVRSYPVEG